MKPVPLTLKEANSHVGAFHRHNKPCRGHRFSLGIKESDVLVGVVVCGRPIARHSDKPGVLEILRLCVTPEAPANACSFLYRAAARVWRAMGGTHVITYTLKSESGSSLRGAGFTREADVPGRSWTHEKRPRETQEVQMEPKIRWSLKLS